MDWNRPQHVVHKWQPFQVQQMPVQQQQQIHHQQQLQAQQQHPQHHHQQQQQVQIQQQQIHHQMQPQTQQVHQPTSKSSRGGGSTTPHCLICNVHLGMFAKGGMEVFSEKVTTTLGKLQIHNILSEIVSQELSSSIVHSSIICKKCFKLIDDIDAMEGKLLSMKQVVSSKYTMTLALVKKGMIGKAVIDEQAKAREPFEPKIKKEPKSSSPEKGKAKGTGKKGRSGKGAKSRKSGNLTVKEGKLVISKIQAAVEESSGEDEPTEFKTETELILVDESLDTYSNTDGATYLCSICDKLFASTETLEAHMEIHSMKTHLLTCSICSKEFLTPEGLEKHIKMHNRRKGKTANSSSSSAGVEISTNTLEFEVDGQKHYKCKLCGKVFSTKSKARDHERTHTGEKPYECDICGTSFRQKSNLSSHKRVTHLQEKRYQCDICEKAFKWRRLLKGHIMSVHTGERPYRCEFCDAGFVYQQHYKKHMRIHTGEKPFKCELCGKSFNSSNNCRAHMFTHSDKKPYECRICGAGFMRKPLVLGHIKQHPHVDDPDGYVKANSPSTAVASITMKEDTTEHGVSPKKETINQRNTVPHTTHTVEDGIHQFIISEPITTREPGNNGEGMNYVFGTFQSQGATHYTSLNLNQW